MKRFVTIFCIFISVVTNATLPLSNIRNVPDSKQVIMAGPECLGRYMYITVSEANRRADGCYVVTIDAPAEGIDRYYNPRGPGMPHYENFLGNTVDIVFNSDLMNELLGFTDDNPATIDIMVNKWYSYGTYNTNGTGTQC